MTIAERLYLKRRQKELEKDKVQKKKPKIVEGIFDLPKESLLSSPADSNVIPERQSESSDDDSLTSEQRF